MNLCFKLPLLCFTLVCAVDIDECERPKASEELCPSAQPDCVNTPGAYLCMCLSGYDPHTKLCIGMYPLYVRFTPYWLVFCVIQTYSNPCKSPNNYPLTNFTNLRIKLFVMIPCPFLCEPAISVIELAGHEDIAPRTTDNNNQVIEVVPMQPQIVTPRLIIPGRDVPTLRPRIRLPNGNANSFVQSVGFNVEQVRTLGPSQLFSDIVIALGPRFCHTSTIDSDAFSTKENI